MKLPTKSKVKFVDVKMLKDFGQVFKKDDIIVVPESYADAFLVPLNYGEKLKFVELNENGKVISEIEDEYTYVAE